MKARKTTHEESFHNHSIMTDSEKNQACDIDILQEIDNQLEYAEQTKCRTFCMRLDLRIPDEIPSTDNKLFSKFQSAFTKNLSRQGLSPQYVAVREHSRGKHQHYHEELFLDGHKTEQVINHIRTAERLWNKTLGLEDGSNHGLVDDCTTFRNGVKGSNGILLDRNDPDYETKKNDVFYRASYLAKVKTKGDTPPGQREIFSSRIPKENKSQQR